VAPLFGVLGDIHGNFGAVDRILDRHHDIGFWLCVGDVASDAGVYPRPSAPIYWIKGNNESFDRIEEFRQGIDPIPNLHFIPNGTLVTIGELKVVGLGGTFAPTWYDTPAVALPAKPRDDKRRHFVREEVNACTSLGHATVLLTHEAPKPFWVELPSSRTPSKKWRRDVGQDAITEVADAIRPRLHCFGHHHRYAAFTRNGVPTICVDLVNRSYLLVDAVTCEWETRPTEGP
jgi:Icc-related predicted phosphoesterase